MAEQKIRRLLIPVAAATEVSTGLTYARQCRQAGQPVEVCLLHVIEPVGAWQVLRFLKREEVATFQMQRASACLDRLGALLATEGIPCHPIIRQGTLIDSIVIAAETDGCDEIVMPAPHRRFCGWLRATPAEQVVARSQCVPVTLLPRY